MSGCSALFADTSVQCVAISIIMGLLGGTVKCLGCAQLMRWCPVTLETTHIESM